MSKTVHAAARTTVQGNADPAPSGTIASRKMIAPASAVFESAPFPAIQMPIVGRATAIVKIKEVI